MISRAPVRGAALCGLLVSLACGGGAVADLAPPPAGFAERVAGGWLPELCAPRDNPTAPVSRLRHWARPRAGERVRVLFICGSQQQFEALALARAFDLDCDLVPLWLAYSWRENDADPDTMNLLRHYLGTRQYRVIAMASAWLSALPDDCERKIAELVTEGGVGLVVALPGIFPRVPAMWGAPSPILDPLLPIALDPSGYKAISRRVVPDRGHALSRGVDFSRIQWTGNTDGTVAPEATVLLRSELPSQPLAAAVTRGRGRVVAYNRCYGEATYGYPFLPCVDSPDDEAVLGKHCRWLGHEESEQQFYSWLGRALLWAAQTEPAVSITAVSINEAGTQATLTMSNTGAGAAPVRLRGVVRSDYGTIEKPLEQRGEVAAGKTATLTVELPDTGRQGRHMADLFLLGAQARVLDWCSVRCERPGPLQVEHRPDFELHQPDEEAPVRLQVRGLAAGRPFTVRTELFDLEGRLLVDQQRTIRSAGEATAVTELLRLGPTGITTALANLRVTVTAGGVSAEVRDQLFVRQDPHWEQFHVKAYDGCDHALLCSDAKISALRRSGHDTLLYSFVNPYKVRVNTETGMRCAAGHVSSCRGYDAAGIKELVGWLRKFSPVVYEQQDEPELQTTPAVEARFDDATNMARFRQWLQGRTGTVAALNQSWGTAYASWDDVKRSLWHEVIAAPNWAPWFDSRRDLDNWFADRFEDCARAIQEVAPDRFCPINPRSLDTFGGVDLGEFARRLKSSSLYNHFCARPPMGYLELGAQWVNWSQTCGGYSWASQPNPDGLAREAWDTVRHGVNQLAWFAPFCDETPPLGRFSYLAGDYSLNEKGKAIAEINQRLLAGPGDVAVNTAPVDDGVLIYYPRTLTYTHTLAFMQAQLVNDPSLDPAKLTGLGPWMEQLPNSFVPPLRAQGFQFRFADEKGLTPEALKITRLVLLSRVVCLGTRELELLRDFVRSGGCVIAEAGTARRDADGRLYSRTPEAFRTLFGVERPAPNPSPVVGMEGLVSCGAERVAGIPPQTGVGFRQGRAFYLDFVLPNDPDGLVLFQQLLDLAGLKPTYALPGNIEKNALVASLVARRRGETTWLYLLGEGQVRSRARIALPREQHVYELTAGRDLGPLTLVEDELRYGEARVYALSADPPGTLEVDLAHATVRPGQALGFACRTGAPGERLLRVECTGPPGAPLPAVPRLLRAPGGRADFSVTIPLNALPGTLTVTVSDLASGARATRGLTVGAARPRP